MTWFDVQFEAADAMSPPGPPNMSTWLDKYQAHVGSVSEGSVLSFTEFQHEFVEYLVNVAQANNQTIVSLEERAHALSRGAKRQGRLGISFWPVGGVLADVPHLVARPEDVPAAANSKGRNDHG